jgi:hypothetical protein
VDTLLLELASGLDTLPGGCDLLYAGGDASVSFLFRPRTQSPTLSYSAINSLAFFLVASVSNDKAASTSVETRPGMMARICLPNSTSCDVMLG